MAELIEVECKYCGAVIDIMKAVKIDTGTGEYEYICENCAIQFKKKGVDLKIVEPDVMK